MKRHVVAFVILLVLGAIINIAVAWGCVLWVPMSMSFGTPWPVERKWGQLAVLCRSGSFGIHDYESLGAKTPPDDAISNYYMLQAGWPVRSLYRSKNGVTFDYLGWPRPIDMWEPEMLSEGVELPTGLRFLDRQWRRFLPVVPLWPGFAINTIFYAAILWLLFAAPGFVRRRIRSKRGLCPACAYPVGTSPVCTECGKPVTQRGESKRSHP